MKTLKQTLILFLSLIILSCDNDDDATNNVCDNTFVEQSIITAFTSAFGYSNFNMDLETHEYRVKINANGEICTVGYQNPSVFSGAYDIEIINQTTSASYTGSHSFSQSAMDYQSITAVPISSGDIILVKRSLPTGSTLFDQGGAAFAHTSGTIPFPVTVGNVEFLSSNAYGAGGPLIDFVMPDIRLGFKVN